MDPLRLEATIDTPAVTLDKTSGVFEMSGKSYPEDTKEFFGSILAWMDLYVADPNADTNFTFKLKYFNSSSYKPIFDILQKLDKIQKKGLHVNVNWFYKTGDTDMQEAGEEFKDLFSLHFTFTSY